MLAGTVYLVQTCTVRMCVHVGWYSVLSTDVLYGCVFMLAGTVYLVQTCTVRMCVPVGWYGVLSTDMYCTDVCSCWLVRCT